MSGQTSSDRDPYAVLGVAPDATQALIDHAYRNLVRRYHPDSRSASEAGQVPSDDASLRHVMAAYRVIGDPARRDDYDHRRPNPSLPGMVSVRVRTPPSRDGALVTAGPVSWNPSPSRPPIPLQEIPPNGCGRGPGVTTETPTAMRTDPVRVEALMAEVKQLQIARDSNRRIGMALGILMNQLDIDDEEAFDVLRRTSQNTNRKLRDVAEDVIRRHTRNRGPSRVKVSLIGVG
jgi:curved DNA-binding protein CbpA